MNASTTSSPASVNVDRRSSGVRNRRGALTTMVMVAGLGAATVLAGCSSQDPAPAIPAVQEAPVTIGVDFNIPEQEVLAEMYSQTFPTKERESSVVGLVDSDLRVQAVVDGEVTMSLGCTGELLGILNPTIAKELAAEYEADPSPDKATSGEWKDRVYQAFSTSLPGDLMATDASSITGCNWLGDTEKERAQSMNPGAVLPQYIVPFYRTPALVREERVDVLNRVSGTVSAREYASMVKKVRKGEDPADNASEWLTNRGFVQEED